MDEESRLPAPNQIPPDSKPKASTKKFHRFLIVLLAVMAGMVSLVYFCGNGHVSLGGGDAAVSPDGKWMAEISDGYSKIHKRAYAEIMLWNLEKYPSLKNGIRTSLGKASTARFEFPQGFDARDPDCKVSWASNSLSFSIQLSAIPDVLKTGTEGHRTFQYDLVTGTFSMGPRE